MSGYENMVFRWLTRQRINFIPSYVNVGEEFIFKLWGDIIYRWILILFSFPRVKKNIYCIQVAIYVWYNILCTSKTILSMIWREFIPLSTSTQLRIDLENIDVWLFLREMAWNLLPIDHWENRLVEMSISTRDRTYFGVLRAYYY